MHDLDFFGSPRALASGGVENSTHPLLVDPFAHSSSHSHPRTSHRRTNRGNQAANAYTDLLQTIEDLVSGGALQLFQQLMSVGRGSPGELHIDLAPIGGHLVPGLDRNHRHGRSTVLSSRLERPSRTETRVETQDFGPLPTMQRWGEEAKLTHGKFIVDRASKLVNHVILALLPPAREAFKETQRRAKELLEEAEQRQKEEEAAKEKIESEARERTAYETLEPPAQVSAEIEGATTVETSMPEAQANIDDDDVPINASQTVGPSDAPRQAVDDVAAPMEGIAVDPPSTPTQSQSMVVPPSAPEPQGAAGISISPSAEPNGENVASGSSSARVTVMIHGNTVDITDTGIDPTFLEALPDDMREEVLNQHFRERRSARQMQPPESQISPEFLEALPPELRAEILQQETSERARFRAPTQPQAGTDPVGPVDIDTASFLATLEPQLRQVVLMEQEDGFLQTLPSHMIAEAGVWRERTHRRFGSPPHNAPVVSSGPALLEIPRKPAAQRDAIQLLDKNGLATLVRLLFFPQLPRKNVLLKIFVNLCENSKTRAELLNLLLHILQDGTGDLAAVDKSFAHLSFRSRPQPSQAMPKSSTKPKPSPLDVTSTSNSWQLAGESVPNLVVQRSLEALTFIVSTNEAASRFFLTEHEIPSGLKRTSSRKGKGKEKQFPHNMHYPIVPLLALLEGPTLRRTPSMMDSLAALLATVTRPLSSLKDGNKKEDSSKDASASAPVAPTEAVTVPPDAGPVLTDPEHDSVEQSSTNVNTSFGESDGQTPPLVDPTAILEPARDEVPSTSIGESPQLPSDVCPFAYSASIFTAEVGTAVPSGSEKPVDAPPKNLLLQLPVIPQSYLRLIVNILTVGECSGRTFQSSLALIQHLSCLPDARDIIASELKSRAQDFGHSIYTDLDDLVAVLQEETAGEEVPATISAKFSPASSDQAKLLRILKTIDYMYSAKGTPAAPQPSSETDMRRETDEEKVHGIYDSFRFAPLWRRLGDCLAIVEEKPDVEHMATVLLPLIESLMVVCKYVGSKPSATRVLKGSASPRSPSTARESMEDLFISFTDAHRKVLNLMVRNNPSLMSGSFSLLVQNPRVLDFDNKRNYFYQQLRRRPHSREHHGTLQLNVRRPHVFEDSFHHLQRKTGEQIKYGKLSVRFYDEEGVDAGGVTREWFQILARQMFNPNYALFQPCAADKLTYQPNRASWVNPEHLSFFKFVGRIIGKAIFDSRLLDAYFARSLYRQLLGKPVDYRDVEWVDPEYYNSLIWILENDPTALDLTFSTEADEVNSYPLGI